MQQDLTWIFTFYVLTEARFGKLEKSTSLRWAVALIIAFLPWEFFLDKDVKTPELVDSIPIFNHKKKEKH